MGIEATGNDVKTVVTYFVCFERNKTAESWMSWGSLLLRQQLGVKVPVTRA